MDESGVINLDAGDKEQAMELTEKLLAINPRYFYARLMQAQIKATEGNLDAAVAETEAVLDEQPHSAQAWLLRGQLAARQGDRATAIQALQRTIAEHVEDPHLYLFLGQLLAADGRTNEAVTAYEKCLEMWRGPSQQREQIEASLAKLRPPRRSEHRRKSRLRVSDFLLLFRRNDSGRGERAWNK